MIEIPQIAILGTGLLGGSLGLALRAGGWRGRLVGVGRRVATVERARELGCVDAALPLDRLAEAVQGKTLVVLATPLGAFADLFARLARCDHPELLVTDVGSTKAEVCALARRVLPDARRFVGSHPMAGGEQQGPEAARADLFAGKPCILTPALDTDPAALAMVESLWRLLGMRMLGMTPEEHDQKVARISHLPHALAALLVALAQRAGGLDVASTGFRDATRLASGDPAVWRDIFTTNRPAIRAALAAMDGELHRLAALLEPGREQDLFDLLAASKAARDAWFAASPWLRGGEGEES